MEFCVFPYFFLSLNYSKSPTKEKLAKKNENKLTKRESEKAAKQEKKGNKRAHKRGGSGGVLNNA